MKKHEKKYIEVEGIMRVCYDSFLKTGNKAYSEIIALADAVPAADVEKVRHGRWEWKEDLKAEDENGWLISEQGYVCSECGFIGSDDFRYCPNCGASMMVEKEAPDLPQEAYYNKGLLRWKMKDEVEK